MSQIVSDIVSCENQIHQFFLNQKIGSLLKRSNIDKEKGISPVSVFRVLVTLAFTGTNLFRTLEAGGSCGMAKDTVYRFLNSVHTNWRRFLLLLSSRVISQELEPLTGTANMKVPIADDTLYRRNRSKYVELLSRVFDHTDKRYYRGFRMLVLGWSDGISFLPVSCALLASSNEKNRPVQQRPDQGQSRMARQMLVTLFDDKFHRLHLHLPGVISWERNYHEYPIMSSYYMNFSGFHATNSGLRYINYLLAERG